jgi:pimeloyl-ACP methyl ester carboxylesterase
MFNDRIPPLQSVLSNSFPYLHRSARHVSIASLLFGVMLALTACAPAAIRPAAPVTSAVAQPQVTREFSVRTPDGISIAVEESGRKDGPAIVFVHGLAQSRVSWLRQLNSPLAREFHLVAYDLRGHGRSDRPTDDAFYAEGRRWGDELAAVIEAAHLRRPVIVAWSLGGVVVANYLRDHGDGNLGGLVFVDAVTHFSPELFGPENNGFTSPLQSSDMAVRTEAARHFMQACFAVPPRPDEMDLMFGSAGVLPAEVIAAIMRISIDGGDDALRSASVSTLVVHGEKDRLVLPLMAQKTVSLVPGARLSLYPAAGHAPFFDDTTRFNDELARFVREIGN